VCAGVSLRDHCYARDAPAAAGIYPETNGARDAVINEGMFTSASDKWETPQEFFDKLDAEFHFDWDVCATRESAKCALYWSEEDDALVQEWAGVCWMNPPYGRQIGQWVQKAYEADATVVCLLPARTDTAWWHDYVMKGEVRFIRGRLHFSGHKWNAPFPSAVVIFRCA